MTIKVDTKNYKYQRQTISSKDYEKEIWKNISSVSIWNPRLPPQPTFALVRGVGGQGVAVEGVLAAVAEEASGVVDALQALARLPVTVADSVGIDVVAALAGPAGPDRPVLTQRVSEEAVVTELTALPYRDQPHPNPSRRGTVELIIIDRAAR